MSTEDKKLRAINLVLQERLRDLEELYDVYLKMDIKKDGDKLLLYVADSKKVYYNWVEIVVTSITFFKWDRTTFIVLYPPHVLYDPMAGIQFYIIPDPNAPISLKIDISAGVSWRMPYMVRDDENVFPIIKKIRDKILQMTYECKHPSND